MTKNLSFRRIRKIVICLSVRSSACMEKLGFCYMDFHNILYLRIFLKYIKKSYVYWTVHHCDS